MDKKQCPKCECSKEHTLGVDYHTRFPRIQGDENKQKIRKLFGVLLGGTTPNVFCNMVLVKSAYNGKTEMYTLTWVCDDCKFQQVETSMSQHYYELAVKIGSCTAINPDDY